MSGFLSLGRRAVAGAVSAAVVIDGLALIVVGRRWLRELAPPATTPPTEQMHPDAPAIVAEDAGAQTPSPAGDRAAGFQPAVASIDPLIASVASVPWTTPSSPRQVEATAGARKVDRSAPSLIVPAAPEAERYPRALWFAAYMSAIVGPFVLVTVMAPTPPRPFIFELGSALGISALSLLALQLVLPARLRLFARLGADVAVRLHRRLADVLVTVIAVHIAVVMIADPSRLALLTFVGEPWRAQAAFGSVVAIVALATTSIVRRRLHLPYAFWRGLHVVLAVGALVLAVVHTIGVNRYLVHGAPVIALAGLTVAGLGATAALRVPHLRRRGVKRYIVSRVVRERGGATTLELAARGHAGQPFAPGQFAWLKKPGVRSSLAEHPFSYSSSALSPDRPSFTIQPYAGFSKEVSEFQPGMQILVDGPHGAFRLSPDAAGCVLISGGIGITPSMSILRTAAEQHDVRPFVLVYAVRSLDRIVFQDQLEALRSELNLTVLYVVSAPPPDWTGQRGRITSDLLNQSLPVDRWGWQFMVCGAPPFVDASVDALLNLDIPGDHIHPERFVGV